MKSTSLVLPILLAGAVSAGAAISYVDPTTGNTTYVDDGTPFNPTGGTNWDDRTTFGNGGHVYQAVPSVDARMLLTTITGLTVGSTYDVYTYYWVAGYADPGPGGGPPTGNNQWDISTGLTLTTTDYAWDGGTNVDGIAGHFDGTVLTTEGNRRLFEIDLGTAVADGSGEIAVYVDDYHPTTGDDDRTWYDGVGYQIPEPSAILLGSLGLLGLLRRRRA